MLHGESVDAAEFLQDYGFQSRPFADSEGLVHFIGGDRTHAVVSRLGDRRYLVDLAEGEVVVADDLGQKVHLTRNGVVIDAGSRAITFRSSVKVRVEAPLLEVTGDVAADGDVSDKSGTAQSMAAMRTTFDEHTHTAPGVTSGPSTLPIPPPNPPLME